MSEFFNYSPRSWRSLYPNAASNNYTSDGMFDSDWWPQFNARAHGWGYAGQNTSSWAGPWPSPNEVFKSDAELVREAHARRYHGKYCHLNDQQAIIRGDDRSFAVVAVPSLDRWRDPQLGHDMDVAYFSWDLVARIMHNGGGRFYTKKEHDVVASHSDLSSVSV